ncbi:MAG: hypothetical protein LBD01_04845, partial [Puniceicoccales bacterium]|nr:hypothetical protein [Puniceicoccales bacterium]
VIFVHEPKDTPEKFYFNSDLLEIADFTPSVDRYLLKIRPKQGFSLDENIVRREHVLCAQLKSGKSMFWPRAVRQPSPIETPVSDAQNQFTDKTTHSRVNI